jgi:NADPH:quinone reductase-like Zn-dependent oxidoreductase
VEAVPQAGWQVIASLEKGRPPAAGQRFLSNAAGGGAGTFAIQVAKASGLEVTEVAR